MWNGWGEGIQTDFNSAPWTNEVMTLTHEEVVHVITETNKIIDEFKVSNSFGAPTDEYVVPKYNESDWAKCINGVTYNVIKGYDPAVNTLGIDGNGIVKDFSDEKLIGANDANTLND
jgi:hypothetical protein